MLTIFVRKMRYDFPLFRQLFQKIDESLSVFFDRTECIEMIAVHIRHQDDIRIDEMKRPSVLARLHNEDVALAHSPITPVEFAHFRADDYRRIFAGSNQHPRGHRCRR